MSNNSERLGSIFDVVQFTEDNRAGKWAKKRAARGLENGIEDRVAMRTIAKRIGLDLRKNTIATIWPQLSEDQRRAVMEPGKPPCFDSEEQWKAWRDVARQSKPRDITTYCEDCSPEYQASMITQGRCRWPTTQFVENVGYRVFIVASWKEKAAARDAASRAHE